MLNIFKTKPLLSETDREFQVETFRWLLRNFGGKDFYEDTVLVLPTKEYFPDKVDSEDEAVKATFARVKEYAGMQEWQCILERQEDNIDPRVNEYMQVENTPVAPLGTFSANDNNEIIITYNPAIVANPTNLVATFAHELAHYLTGGCKEPPPGGWDNWEFATDLAAVFMGFGIFMANSAFSFRQFQSASAMGWQAQRNGYLSEVEYAYALAIFCKLKNLDEHQPLPLLDKGISKLYRKSLVEINTMDLIKQIK